MVKGVSSNVGRVSSRWLRSVSADLVASERACVSFERRNTDFRSISPGDSVDAHTVHSLRFVRDHRTRSQGVVSSVVVVASSIEARSKLDPRSRATVLISSARVRALSRVQRKESRTHVESRLKKSGLARTARRRKSGGGRWWSVVVDGGVPLVAR
ncbi:hypothetical protein K0M31_003153 [Melipona bicolor]|uniref:Uncharacterized protein n=1 Tax=Melipona bicolor TaxID=60889 RepID=A0AA40FZ35_9HYME|nr:hypothetical protein K0M31_003153 [Melipona bicolor]